VNYIFNNNSTFPQKRNPDAHVLFVLNRIAEPQFGGQISLPNWGSAVRISAKRT